jgi:predicted enzyme related to lactoylglutathione lyase
MSAKLSDIDYVQLISVTLGVQEIEPVVAFYEKTLGMKFAYSLTDARDSFHTVVSAGVQFIVDKLQGPEQKGVMFHFAVSNMEKFKKNAVSSGGKVVAEHLPVALSEKALAFFVEEHPGLKTTQKMGTLSIFKDPAGTSFGAIQLEDWAQYLFVPGNRTVNETKNHEAGLAIGEKFRKLVKK